MNVNDEPCMCGTDFTCMADDHDYEVAKLSGALVHYAEAAELVGVPETTVRQWRSRHHLDPVALDHHGLLLFRREDVLRANQEAMDCPAGRKRKRGNAA